MNLGCEYSQEEHSGRQGDGDRIPRDPAQLRVNIGALPQHMIF